MLAAFAVLWFAATAAASTSYLGGTVTDNSPSAFNTGSLSSATGSPDAALATAKSTNGSASSTWSITAGFETSPLNLGGSTSFTLTIWTQSESQAQISGSLSQIIFTDGGGNTKTVSSGFGNVTGTKKGDDGTVVSFAFNTTYASGGSFNASQITQIQIDILLSSSKNGKTFGVDALQIQGTASAVPEPATFALFAVGAAGIGFGVRRGPRRARKRRHAERR